MHNCSNEYKEVPNGMRIFFAFPDIKEDAQSVKYAAQNQENRSQSREILEQAFRGEYNHPSHREIKADRPDFGPAAGGEKLEKSANKSQPPNNAEQGPAQGSAKINEQKWRISAGNEVEDGNMIKLFKAFFPFLATYGMINGRRAVKNYHRCPKDRRRYHSPSVSMQGGKRHQNHQPGDTQTNTDSVDNTVPNFFFDSVGAPIRL